MRYSRTQTVEVVKKKFFRKRICKNPDCFEPFDPLNPSAECCCEECRNRRNYLRRKAIKLGINKDDLISIWSFSVLQCMLDQGLVRPSLDALKVYNFQFPANDVNQIMKIANLVLIPLENNIFKIQKYGE